MQQPAIFVALLLVALISPAAGLPSPAQSRPPRLPLEFVENRGQWAGPARYVAGTASMSARFETGAIRLSLKAAKPDPLTLAFEGASNRAVLTGEGRQPGRYHYFVGNDPAKWRSNTAAFRSVRYRGLYPGIDLVARDAGGRLEYDLVLAPGADLDRFVVRAEGASGIELAKDGSLLVRTAAGLLRQTPPKTWEVLPSGKTRPVTARFKKRGKNRYGFEAPGRNPQRRLVIDPGLEWATFYGGHEREEISAVALTKDGSGDIVVVGRTFSADLPRTSGALTGVTDSYVARFNSDGSTLRYATVFGGTQLYSDAYDVALDSAGAPIVVGTTRAVDHPVTPGAYDTTYNGNGSVGDDAFVTKFDSTGSRLVFSTFLGASPTADAASGAGSDFGSQVAVDPSGNVIVAGITYSPDFPTTAGAYDRTLSLINDPAKGTMSGADIFIARLDPTGARLTYSTFIGGQSYETLKGMVVDPLGFVTVVGNVWVMQDIDANGNAFPVGTPFPTTADALLRNHADNYYTAGDAFLARLKLDGGETSDLKYATILGGWSSETAAAVAVDPHNSELVTLTGGTYSYNFRTTKGALRRGPISHDDWQMAYVSRFRFPAAGGGQLVWSTLLGGPGHQSGTDVAVDGAGNAIVVGWGGMDFPTTERSFMRASVSQDAIVARVSADGTQIQYATLLGGSSAEYDPRVAWAGGSSVVVTGWTISPDFPVTPGAFDTLINTDGTTTPINHWEQERQDAFLAGLSLEPNPTADTTAAAPSLLSPANGAVFPAPTEFALPTVTFDWSDVADPSGVRLYQIEISPDPDFFLNRLNVAQWVVLEPTVSQASVTFSQFFGHVGRFYWRVRTLDGVNNWSPWSPARLLHLGESQIPRISHVALAAPDVTGGGTVQGVAVLRNRLSPAGGTVLNVRSNNTAAATVPAQVVVPAGSDRVAFTITTRAVSRSTPVLISVDDTGLPDSKTLWVEPGTVTASLSALSLSPATVTGGTNSTGTVTLTAAAPSGGLVVTLTSSNTTAATVPASVTVAAGATSASFPITTNTVTAATSVTISGTQNGVTRSAALAVNPPPALSLSSVTLSPTSVNGGQASTGTVKLSAAAPSGGVVVTLSSGNTNGATVPSSVTVAAGATSANFTVSTKAVTTSISVTISAVYAGVTRTASLSVNPATTADTVAIQKAEYSSGRLRVEATSTRSTATLKVYVTATGVLIGTLTNAGSGRYRGEFNWSTNPQNITVKSSAGGSASATVRTN